MSTTKKHLGISGLKLWRARVRKTYSSLEQLEAYDQMYDIAKRCGYDSPAELWEANPMLQGSTDPADFGIAK